MSDRKEYMKKWQQENREKTRANANRWRLKNIDKIKEKRKTEEYKQKHRKYCRKWAKKHRKTQQQEIDRLNNIISELEKEIDWLLERQYESERFAKEQGFDTYLPAKVNLEHLKNKLKELKEKE